MIPINPTEIREQNPRPAKTRTARVLERLPAAPHPGSRLSETDGRLIGRLRAARQATYLNSPLAHLHGVCVADPSFQNPWVLGTPKSLTKVRRCRDRDRSCEPAHPRLLCVAAPLTASRFLDYPTRSGWLPRGSSRIHGRRGGGLDPCVSRFNDDFLEVVTGGSPSVFSVHLERFRQRFT